MKMMTMEAVKELGKCCKSLGQGGESKSVVVRSRKGLSESFSVGSSHRQTVRKRGYKIYWFGCFQVLW